MSVSEYRDISPETAVKVLKVAATILKMHGVVAGSRICQDWSGDDQLSPEIVFTDSELNDLALNYEQTNSNGDDYMEGFHGMGDEMKASFVIADAVGMIADAMNAKQEGE